jgi:hypothetical protein
MRPRAAGEGIGVDWGFAPFDLEQCSGGPEGPLVCDDVPLPVADPGAHDE